MRDSLVVLSETMCGGKGEKTGVGAGRVGRRCPSGTCPSRVGGADENTSTTSLPTNRVPHRCTEGYYCGVRPLFFLPKGDYRHTCRPTRQTVSETSTHKYYDINSVFFF